MNASLRHPLSFAAALFVAVAVTACAGHDCPTCPTPPPPAPAPAPTPTPTPTPAPAPVLQSVVIVAPATLDVGRDSTLTLRATMSDGSTANPTQGVTWTTSNARVLGINANGVASAIASGVATISASYQGKASSLDVVVTAPAPAVNLAGLWTMTPTISSGARGCDAAAHPYQVTLSQSGNTLNATAVTPVFPANSRPLGIAVKAFRIVGTVLNGTVSLDITIDETGPAGDWETKGLFAGTTTNGTIGGSFNGTVFGARGNCNSPSHTLTFTK